MKFCIKDFFNRYVQTRSFLRIWSHLLEKCLMERFIFWAVKAFSRSFSVQIFHNGKTNYTIDRIKLNF